MPHPRSLCPCVTLASPRVTLAPTRRCLSRFPVPPPGTDPSSPEAVAAGGVLDYILTQVGSVYWRTVCVSGVQDCCCCKAVAAGGVLDYILTQVGHVCTSICISGEHDCYCCEAVAAGGARGLQRVTCSGFWLSWWHRGKERNVGR